MIGQSRYRGAGRRGGRPFRGGGRGHFGPRPDGSAPPFHGRGRGRHFPPNSASLPGKDPAMLSQGEASQIQGEPPQALLPPPYASALGQGPFPAKTQGHTTPIWPPPRMAWCELCRVDCNTTEILEQHKNGKRHKKNFQVYEELQKLNKLLVGGQNEQMAVSKSKGEVSDQPEKVEISGDTQLQENSSPQAVMNENKVENEHQNVSEEAEPTEKPTRRPRMDQFEARGHGFKRKMRGGRGGKRMRTFEGSRRQFEPPKPKEVIPLICEFCNVKCESPVVFESHLMGKKHLSNLKRFQGHQAMLGQATLQALYPALQALYPALQALCQPNPNASTSFGPQFHQQGIHGLQGFFAQPGPSVFPHGQASAVPGPATTSASAPPLILETQDQQDSMLPRSTSRSGSPSAVTGETKNQQQSVTVNFEAERAVIVDAKSENGTSKFGEEVNLPTDNSVVVPLENTVTGAEQVFSGTVTEAAVANPEGNNGPSDQVAITGLDSKREKLESKSEEPTVTGAEQVISGTAMEAAVANREGEYVPSDQVAITGLNSKTGKIKSE